MQKRYGLTWFGNVAGYDMRGSSEMVLILAPEEMGG
jgi:hypothetical protein